MKTLLKEARQNIPEFDSIWEAFKNALLSELKRVKPSRVQGFYRYHFIIYNIDVPPQAFFSSYTTMIDLYVAQNENDYNKIGDDFNQSQVFPNVKLNSEGKIQNIQTTFKIATSKNNMLKDVLGEFYHELTHAYEFWEKLTTKGQNGVQGKPSNVTGHMTYDAKTLRSIIYNNNLSALEKNLAIFYYFVDPSEYQARLNTFYGQISYEDLSIKTNEKIIESTRVWRQIVFFKNVVDYLNNVNSPSDQQKLMIIANVMNGNSQKFTNFQMLCDDVESKYTELVQNSKNDFSEIVDELKR